MKTLNKTEQLAHKQQFPKKAIKYWQVKLNGQVVYQNNFVALCQHYINQHNLTNAKITAKR